MKGYLSHAGVAVWSFLTNKIIGVIMCDVIYEDNQIIVAIKPQNIPTQGDESGDEDFLSQLKGYVKEKYNKPGEAYLGLVHRLDRPTGGVMVFARTSKSAERLSEQIRSGEMEKSYFAVLDGTPRLKQARLVNYLKKDEKNNIVRVVPQYESGAKEAILDYRVLETKDNKTLVKVDLQTGRSHQIRVQMSNISCPVVGDQKYGKDAKKCNLALWSTILKFTHPVTKKIMTFKVSPPADKTPWKAFSIDKYL